MFVQNAINIMVSLMVVTSMLFGASSQLRVAAQVDNLAANAAVSAPISPTDETKVPHYFGPWPNYANSPFTVSDAAVTLLGEGLGATATASIDANGVVTAITITNPGSGYIQATTTVSITGSGTGATADPVISTTGVVTGITVTAPGFGYA